LTGLLGAWYKAAVISRFRRFERECFSERKRSSNFRRELNILTTLIIFGKTTYISIGLALSGPKT
jgi:hypothetical protein